jgi:ribonuclease HI
MSYYAVAKGHNIGIYYFWDDCKEQVLGYSGAVYKKFNTEKEAEDYILNITSCESEIFENIYNKYDLSEVNQFIYTDGSCYKNDYFGSVCAIGIFYGFKNNNNISKILNDNSINHTNNYAELYAIIEAYESIKDELLNKKICIYTDSEYCIKCATSYGEKCNNNNWEKDIPNKELVKKIYTVYSSTPNLLLKHIKAHTNKKDRHSIGNANADKLAYSAIKFYKKDLKINS